MSMLVPYFQNDLASPWPIYTTTLAVVMPIFHSKLKFFYIFPYLQYLTFRQLNFEYQMCCTLTLLPLNFASEMDFSDF